MRVLPGHRVEIVAPELPVGEMVEVFLVLSDASESHAPSMTTVLLKAEESAGE